MFPNQNRNKYSLFNAISALVMTLLNGLMGIVVTRLVIQAFGSDFNGLNSTANQIVNVLLVLEGGFTMASNVALFAPLSQNDYDTVNGVLAATKNKFYRIGLIFLALGLLISVGYGFVVNSNLPTEFVITLIVMTVVPSAFNLFYATTYRVLLQTQQKEYIINIITTATLTLGYIATIVMIQFDGPMWMVRFNTMVFSLINSIVIAWYTKKKTAFLNLRVDPQPEKILGTGDVMAQKITGVIYYSAPIVFLSISPTGGTILASVYAVYNNVFNMLKNLLHGVIDAPRLGLGQMLTERDREGVWPVFAQYEYMAFLSIFTLLTTGATLIMPFVKIYMNGITDANYYDMRIAVLMVLITTVEMLHIPSGHLINMAGEFRVSRNFQIIACVVLIVAMGLGGSLWGIYGMLGAILMVAVLLAVLEIGYIHFCFFRKKIFALIRLLVPLLLCGVFLCVIEWQLDLAINGYFAFFCYGILFVGINACVAVVISLIFDRSEFLSLVRRAKRLITRS